MFSLIENKESLSLFPLRLITMSLSLLLQPGWLAEVELSRLPTRSRCLDCSTMLQLSDSCLLKYDPNYPDNPSIKTGRVENITSVPGWLLYPFELTSEMLIGDMWFNSSSKAYWANEYHMLYLIQNHSLFCYFYWLTVSGVFSGRIFTIKIYWWVLSTFFYGYVFELGPDL